MTEQIFYDGFESGDFSAWDANGVYPPTGWTVTTDKPYSGTYSAKAIVSGQIIRINKTLSQQYFEASITHRRYIINLNAVQNSQILVVSHPSISTWFLSLNITKSAGIHYWRVQWWQDGKMKYYTTSTVVIQDAWFKITAKIKVAQHGYAEILINDKSIWSKSDIDNQRNNYTVRRFFICGTIGGIGSTATIWVDDVYFYDIAECPFGYTVNAGQIRIGDTIIDRIIDFYISESADFASSPVIGKKMPTIEGGMYVTGGKNYRIIARVTKTERDNLQTEKDNHATLSFVYDLNIEDCVKIEEFESVWDGEEEYTDDWLVILTLVSTLK